MVNAANRERFASVPENERQVGDTPPFNTTPVNMPVNHANATLLRVTASGDSLQESLRKVTAGQRKQGAQAENRDSAVGAHALFSLARLRGHKILLKDNVEGIAGTNEYCLIVEARAEFVQLSSARQADQRTPASIAVFGGHQLQRWNFLLQHIAIQREGFSGQLR
jgi:hypothetical protein